MELMVIGNRGGTNIGGSFERAARALGVEVYVFESQGATQAPWLVRKFNWCVLGHRPAYLQEFGRKLLVLAAQFRPDYIVTIGLAPVGWRALSELGSRGIKIFNYLTDDPWNPALRSSWFFEAVVRYDIVFTPRRANIGDLEGIGCKRVCYLPFAYDPLYFYPDPPRSLEGKKYICDDIVFFGGADKIRAEYIAALINANFKIGLYGGYWNRFPETRNLSHGQAQPYTLRNAVSTAKISLNLVRRQNRDGHSMRSFEIPAIGACMLTEDTPEHREFFGDDNENVVYFKTKEEMVMKAKYLMYHEDERRRLAAAVHTLIIKGSHTYEDRLRVMLTI